MAFPGYKTLGVSLTEVQTAAEYTILVTGDGSKHKLGTRVSDDVGNEYVWMEAGGAIVATDVVGMSALYVAVVDGPFAFGVANGSIASGGAGWIQVKGVTDAAVVSACALGDLLSRLVVSTQLAIVLAEGTAIGDEAVFATALEADTSNVASIYIF
jgi:hypothetical protein